MIAKSLCESEKEINCLVSYSMSDHSIFKYASELTSLVAEIMAVEVSS